MWINYLFNHNQHKYILFVIANIYFSDKLLVYLKKLASPCLLQGYDKNAIYHLISGDIILFLLPMTTDFFKNIWLYILAQTTLCQEGKPNPPGFYD